ncbi:uncharacterized protein LOC121367431 [Gigantopelta aegis]|uniref:uncharacterized protein LOC121367431 n=1 Tax=Gigantopelta aegis TaxID=1735272 RepID=UPI001B88965D|nr:uncharacterized protein LOC121367431 [Gigantopelta aegis]
MTVATRNFLFKVVFDVLLLPLLVESASIQTTEYSITSYSHILAITVVVSVTVFLVLSAVVLFLCGDCYNSEVSSSSHPACVGNKWGGGEGYQVTAAQDLNSSAMQSSSTFGEVVNPASEHPGLPYSMVPTHIQTEQHFVGYESAPSVNISGYTGGNEPQVNRYGGGGLQRGGGSQRGGQSGMHINPLEDAPEELPPSYNEAVRR